VALHHGQKAVKFDKTVPGLQEWIIDDQTSVYFRSTPTGLCKSPFNVEHGRHRRQKMLSDIEILCRHFGIDIDNLTVARKEDRDVLVLDFQEGRTGASGNDVNGILMGAIEDQSAIKAPGRASNAHPGHDPTKVDEVIRHSEIYGASIDLGDCGSLIPSK